MSKHLKVAIKALSNSDWTAADVTTLQYSCEILPNRRDAIRALGGKICFGDLGSLSSMTSFDYISNTDVIIPPSVVNHTSTSCQSLSPWLMNKSAANKHCI